MPFNTYSFELNTSIPTSGDGYWSRKVALVDVTRGVCVVYYDDDDVRDPYGELRLYFTSDSWQTPRDGLIYTDKKFLEVLRLKLFALGIEHSDISYSEQGMQGIEYVSFDVGHKFINSISSYTGTEIETRPRT